MGKVYKGYMLVRGDETVVVESLPIEKTLSYCGNISSVPAPV